MSSSTTNPTTDRLHIDNTGSKWVPSQSTTLASLLAIVDKESNPPDTDGGQSAAGSAQLRVDGQGSDAESGPVPWRPGHELRIEASGGLHDLEDRRISIASGSYVEYVDRNLTLDVEGDYDLTVDGDLTATVAKSGLASPFASDGADDDAEGRAASALAGTDWGADTLVVKGNASMRVEKDQTNSIAGGYDRTWSGNVYRFSGSDGVICGGAFARILALPSVTASALWTGDVYGAAARIAGVRIHVAAMNYRASKTGAWAFPLYVRSTRFTVVPAQGSPSQDKKSRSSKVAQARRIGLALCPLLEMATGVVMLPFALVALCRKFYQWARHRKPWIPPPAGPPRTLVRNGATELENAGSHVNM